MSFEFNPEGTVESLEVVPSHLKPLYTQTKEGGYVVNPEMKELASAVFGLQSALAETQKVKKSANDEAAKYRISLKQLKEAAAELGLEDLTPETLREHFTKLSSTKGEELKINLEKIRADHDRRLKEATDAKDNEVKTMRATLDRYLVENASLAEIAAQKGIPDLLLPHIKQHVKVFNDNGEYVVRVVDAQGEARSNGKGGWMTVRDLIAELKASPVFGRAFEADSTVGMGTKTTGSVRPVTTQQHADMTPVAKIAAGLRRRNM